MSVYLLKTVHSMITYKKFMYMIFSAILKGREW